MNAQSFAIQPQKLDAWRGQSELSLMGIGAALPGDAIKTEDLLAHVDKVFDLNLAGRGRIYAQKLNVKERHLSRELTSAAERPKAGCSNPELAADAIRAALNDAGFDVSEVGYIIGHTATPAMLIPSNVALVSEYLGYNGPHMELRQACTGFANALVIAEGLLANPDAKPVVIVGSETGSVYFDPNRAKDDAGQLVNMVQMGDAAAAVVLCPNKTKHAAKRKGTISKTYYGQLGGSRVPGFSLPIGGSNQPFGNDMQPEFEHSFAEVRKSGPELFLAGLSVSESSGIHYTDAHYILPHQANGLMDELLEETLGVPKDKTLVNGDKVGNTGSAAIWLALAQSFDRFSKGETVLVLGAEATKYMFGGFLYTHGA